MGLLLKQPNGFELRGRKIPDRYNFTHPNYPSLLSNRAASPALSTEWLGGAEEAIRKRSLKIILRLDPGLFDRVLMVQP